MSHDVEFSAAFDVNARQGRAGSFPTPIFRRSRTTPTVFAEVRRQAGVRGAAVGPTMDGIGTLCHADSDISEADDAAGRRGAARCATATPKSWSPTCRSARSRPREYYAEAGAGSRDAPSSTASRCSSRPTPAWAQRFTKRPGCRWWATTSRARWVPPSFIGTLANLFRERGVQARSHLPAQFRRQHRLPEHAGARAAGVEEAQQDAGGDQPIGDAAGRRRPCMWDRAIMCRG